MLDQRVYELEAAGDDDVPVYLLLQRRDLGKHVTLEHGRVVPGGMFEGRRHDVLGQAVQPVRQLASAGRPPRSEPLIAPPAQQERLLPQRLVERELAELRVVADQADPAAVPEAFVTGRVLDDSVERDVFAHHDLSHLGPPFSWCFLAPPRPVLAAGVVFWVAGRGAGAPVPGRSRRARRRRRRRTGSPRSARRAGWRLCWRPGSRWSGKWQRWWRRRHPALSRSAGRCC